MNTTAPNKGPNGEIDPRCREAAAGIFRHGVFLLLAVLSCWSCGTASKSAVRPEPPAVETRDAGEAPPESPGEGESPGDPVLPPAPEDPGESPGEDEAPDEPLAFLSPEAPVESPGPEDLEEPPFDFPEAALEPLWPPERPLAALPEPLAPVFPEAPPGPVEGAGETGEIEGAGEAEEIRETGEEEAAFPSPAGEGGPPLVEEPVPPAPPPFIRPAERYEAPPVREPVPLPRIPDPPARSPPVEIPEPGIVYSRVVRATVGQLVEIPFRGTGWVYLGELASRPGIVYGSRRLDPEGQSFIFRTEAPGTYGLKFYKQDFVRDYILNDHVQVIVGEPPEAALMGWFDPAVNRGRVIAEPRWPSALEEAEALGGNSPARIAAAPGLPGAQGAAQAGTTAQGTATAQETAAREAATAQDAVQTGTTAAQGVALGTATQGAAQAGTTAQGAATQGTATAQETAAQETAGGGALPAGPAAQTPGQDGESGDPRIGDYPERARREFEAGRAASAISILDQFRERYPSGSDEAWWLYGQFYEADSPSRDIRSALDYYRRLVREYPQSPRCNDARRRIAYLERYYINIR